MVTNLLPFSISFGMGAIAGTVLWALALYLGFSPVADRVMDGCHRWLQTIKVDGSTPAQTSTPSRHEAQMAMASLLSVIPFLLVGGLTHYGLSLSLDGSWAVSMGVIAFIIGGVYELGRQSGTSS